MRIAQWTRETRRYHTTIDGQDVQGLRCHVADEEAGEIACYFWPILVDQDGRPRSYLRYGQVVITPPAEEAP